MNADNALKTAYDAVLAEEQRLASEYARVKAARIALERGMTGGGAVAAIGGRASPSGLKEAILVVLEGARHPMSNGAIREALTKSRYAHSLDVTHVSKTITKLLRAKQVKRIGEGTGSQYVRASK